MNYPFDPRGCVVGRNMVNRVRTAASLHSRKHPLSAQDPQLAWGLHGGCEVARAEFKVGGLKTPIRSNTAAGASQCGRSPERPFWAADPGVPVSGEQGPFSYAHRSVSPAGPDPVNPRNPDYFTRSVKLHPRPRQPRHPARKAGLKPRAPYGVRRFTAAFRRDVLVTSASQCWIIQCLFPGHDKRAPPKYPSEGPARQVRFSEGRACHVRFAMLDYPMFIPRARQACPSEASLGGTCSSGPLVQRSIIHGLRRGLKSRAESGAKAPHSMECGDLPPLFGGTCLSRPLRNVGLSNVYSPGTTSVPLRSIPRRDLLVRSAFQPWMIHPNLLAFR